MSASPSQTAPEFRLASLPGGRNLHLRLTLAEAIMGLFPPFSMNRTRLLALKASGLRCGRGTLFWGLPKLSGSGKILSRLSIGSYCGFNDGCVFDLMAQISIGDNVSVGHEVRFVTTVIREGIETAAPITIGDGAWLGARSTILGGVTVGAGSVIGAGVTVATDVPPNTLLTGAKPISLAKWR